MPATPELQCHTCGGVVPDRSKVRTAPSDRTLGVPMPHGGRCRCAVPVVDRAITPPNSSRPAGSAERGASSAAGLVAGHPEGTSQRLVARRGQPR
jgi:hypothetical protein